VAIEDRRGDRLRPQSLGTPPRCGPENVAAFGLRATAYDATYVALAERLECTLLTADQRLAAAPMITCPVEVLHP